MVRIPRTAIILTRALLIVVFLKGLLWFRFLGDDVETVIENGDLQIVNESNEFFFGYAEQRWPLNTKSSANLTQVNIAWLNQDKSRLLDIANEQYYRLCSWKETDKTINYRRFFTVNGLICINIQHQEVFNHFHRLIAQLLKENVIQGLRIDHIDGLYNPEQYLQRLRKLAGHETYIVAEKILEPGEELPAWPIQGTTGYDFLAQVNNLFTNRKSEKTFTSFYNQLTGKKKLVGKQILDKKNLILTTHMNGELDNLTNYFIQLKLGDVANHDAIKNGIAELLINFPVYRLYGNSWPLAEKEKQELIRILQGIDNDALMPLTQTSDEGYNQRVLNFYQRCMQFSGPLMAKGVEDTLMYTYNRFIDHNEVGDSPHTFGLPVDEFHTLMQQRQLQWPMALSATATHDTKRGEGVRARLNVLSDISDEWIKTVIEWQAMNADLKLGNAPDNNDEYFIYQTLVGVYPMPGEEVENFETRFTAYLEKTLREAKRHSSWVEPNEDYENAVKYFAISLLDTTRPFWKSFTEFHQKVSNLGTINSLAQVTLKLTCPGVPDIYQGCELWDLSMVDPDNRRPVNYQVRQKYLDDDSIDIKELWKNRFNGQIKIWLLQRLLNLRAKKVNIFKDGSYIPLKISGKNADKAIAFARAYQGEWIVTITAIRPVKEWMGTYLHLPPNAPACYENVFTKEKAVAGNRIKLSKVLKEIPVAVLQLCNSQKERSAGILLHITSLPSTFGIGDFGPQARRFADKLKSTHQRYWQVLPLNSVSPADGFSPYSSTSSQAGNILLISPELLVEYGLLTVNDLQQYYPLESGHSNFEIAQEVKNALLNLAWEVYNAQPPALLKQAFEEFCMQEDDWLSHYALYCVLKDLHNQSPWHAWPNEHKFRDRGTLDTLLNTHSYALEKVKWLQFIFTKQWTGLKEYCNNLGISIFGDLPFYISYDSADVWAKPSIFQLDEKLQMASVSGVPPDYFNENGQRWGTPVYNWGKLKEQKYVWWVKRIEKNLQLYDLLRLDHFRAFSAYWAVPVEEETAKNGKWVNGPGADLFDALSKAINNLPLIAEDLGEIDDKVRALKDEFSLPGMKVLQFAFGDDIAESEHIPHHHKPNYVVYTGTHDNNTTLGWYRHDAGKTAIKNIKRYSGNEVNEKKIARTMTRMALASVCQTAIIPLQDWLNLDERSRMNTPAGEENTNWKWQLTDEAFESIPTGKIKKWTVLFGRI
jgi:malto-oligosyltrehalose synthase/4-alpha-glucanotransferase